MILATNTLETYAIFNYIDMSWSSSEEPEVSSPGLNDSPAFVYIIYYYLRLYTF